MIKTIDLSGEWSFSLGNPDFNDTITLPCTTAQAHKGTLSDKAESGYLTELYPYLGKAYYKRKITVPAEYAGSHFFVFLERTRVTRLSANGRLVGTLDSLATPHCYDITEYVLFEDNKDAEVLLEITVSNDDYPIGGGHMTSPDTQTNWLGILGRMELQIFGAVRIDSTRVLCDAVSRSLTLQCNIFNDTDSDIHAGITIEPVKTVLRGLILADGKNYASHAEELTPVTTRCEAQSYDTVLTPGIGEYSFTYHFDADAQILWSEHSPYSMTAELTLKADDCTDKASAYAGIRSFKADTHDFLINGIPTKLRGKHDALLFPITGAAPMDLNSWLKVMGTAWRYGINHYRYHTCCPPEAAFIAADLLGIYMEPELPFWGTVAAPGEEYFNEKEQVYLIEEGKRILTAFANHPSFCMMSMGNELWGSRERINDIIRMLKAHDDRPLYTEGSNNFQFIPEIIPDEDFFVGARLTAPVNGENKRLIRGSFATCDAPLGVIQTKAPSTADNFDAAILSGSDTPAASDGDDIAIQYGTGVKIVKADASDSGVSATLPIVSHEIGQYFMYPDYSQIDKYTGVLAPRNLELFRKALADARLGEFAHDFYRDSGRLSLACYREELEMMHRSRYMAGYQLLDLQDYTGQGTALVGVLDAFMESKGLISESDWRHFCSDSVLLASFEKYVYTEGEDFSAQIMVSMFNPLMKLSGHNIEWNLELDGNMVYRGSIRIENDVYGTQTLGQINFTVPVLNSAVSAKAIFSLKIDGTEIANSYVLWFYKEVDPFEIDDSAADIYIAHTEADALFLASQCKNVLLFPTYDDEHSIPGFYCADFWNYTMFKQISENMGRPVAVGTLGLSIDSDHPALAGFACETYSTPQWYSLISACKCTILDVYGIKPIVRMIDNPWRNHNLGIIYEYNTHLAGKILACTIPEATLESSPEGRVLYGSLVKYLGK